MSTSYVASILSQSYGKLALLDLILIILYLALCLFIGFKNAGKIKNIRQYVLGNGDISTATLVTTIYATYLGAGATIGTIERVSAIGALVALTLFLKPVSWLLVYNIFGKNIRQFIGCLTSIDIMGRLYGFGGSIITAVASIMLNVATIAAQAIALGHLLHYFLEIPANVGICIGLGTIIFYSMLGGARAVVTTDLFQFAVFYIVMPVLCGLFLREVGGWQIIADMVPTDRWNINLDSHDKVWMFIGCIVYMLIPEHSAPFIQRFLMSMDVRQLRKSLVVVAMIDLTVIMMICMLGFVFAANIGGEISAKTVIWHMINQQLFIVLKGLAVIGILAIIMSTADSYLNISGAILACDVVKRIRPGISDAAELAAARIGTLLTGLLAVSLALYGSSVLELVWLATNFYCPIISVPIAAGFMRFRTNNMSFLVSVLVAIPCTVLGAKIQGSFDVLSLVFGMSGSAIGLFGAHYLQLAFGKLQDVAKQEKADLKLVYIREAERLGVNPEEVLTILANERQEEAAKRKGMWQCIYENVCKVASWRMRDLIFYSQERVERYGEKYYEFAIFGICFCIVPLLFIDSSYNLYVIASVQPMWLSQVALRILISFGCLGLAMQHMWPVEMRKKYMPLYFHFMVMSALPMLATYSYLADPLDKQNLAAMALAAFSLALMVDWLTLLIISAGGFLLANLLYCICALISGMEEVYAHSLNGAVIYIALSLVVAEFLRFIQDKHTNQLYNLATTDSLTGLTNRRSLEAGIIRLVEDAYTRGKPLSAISVDIDHFKKLNDTYGHDLGDKALIELSAAIQNGARPLDICARVGGEEFVIILSDTTLSEAEMIAERLRSKVASITIKQRNKDTTVCFTISGGVVQLQHGESWAEMLKRADDALYAAKGDDKGGRNRMVVEGGELSRDELQEAVQRDHKAKAVAV